MKICVRRGISSKVEEVCSKVDLEQYCTSVLCAVYAYAVQEWITKTKLIQCGARRTWAAVCTRSFSLPPPVSREGSKCRYTNVYYIEYTIHTYVLVWPHSTAQHSQFKFTTPVFLYDDSVGWLPCRGTDFAAPGYKWKISIILGLCVEKWRRRIDFCTQVQHFPLFVYLSCIFVRKMFSQFCEKRDRI